MILMAIELPVRSQERADNTSSKQGREVESCSCGQAANK
jgi:hypothetical protein